MILTTCAVCAKSLDLDAPAHCVGCQTRYCSDRCLRYHAHRGGHDDECEEIERAGGAEQFNAEKKYAEAAAVAVEACAEETAGHTCYICLEDGSEEGLVRMCACRGAAGFSHLSCLVRQAKTAAADIEEPGLEGDDSSQKWQRWLRCGLCKQRFHGTVQCALGWACWKTYVGRPELTVRGEVDGIRISAMSSLANGLSDPEVGRYDEALRVYEADLAYTKRHDADNFQALLATRDNIAICLAEQNRKDEALALHRDIFAETVDHFGTADIETLEAAHSLAFALVENGDHAECLQFFIDYHLLDLAMEHYGAEHNYMLQIRTLHARTLCEDENASLDNLRQAVELLEDIDSISSRVFGARHPDTAANGSMLRYAREKLAQAEAPVARRTRSKAEES